MRVNYYYYYEMSVNYLIFKQEYYGLAHYIEKIIKEILIIKKNDIVTKKTQNKILTHLQVFIDLILFYLCR